MPAPRQTRAGSRSRPPLPPEKCGASPRPDQSQTQSRRYPPKRIRQTRGPPRSCAGNYSAGDDPQVNRSARGYGYSVSVQTASVTAQLDSFNPATGEPIGAVPTTDP